MLDFIMIPLVVGIITLGIYKLFELFIRKKERLTIIEKIGERFEPSMIENKFSFPSIIQNRFSFGTLKAACLLLGIGLGLLTGFFIAQYYFGGYELRSNDGSHDYYQIDDSIKIIYGASVLLFGGFGLMMAFIIEMKIGKKKE